MQQKGELFMYELNQVRQANKDAMELSNSCSNMYKEAFSGNESGAEDVRLLLIAECARLIDTLERFTFNNSETAGECNSENKLGIDFYFDEKNHIFKCIIPGRLNRRPHVNGVSSQKQVTGYDLAKYKQDIIESFNSYFKDHVILFDRRVDVIITSHYNDMNHMVDYDNLEIKPIIDAISRNMLVDDNPMCCRLILDAVYGNIKKEFTEVVVQYCAS